MRDKRKRCGGSGGSDGLRIEGEGGKEEPSLANLGRCGAHWSEETQEDTGGQRAVIKRNSLGQDLRHWRENMAFPVRGNRFPLGLNKEILL